MEDLQHRYARLILEAMARVQEGDAVSINTEGNGVPFAQMLARMASEITLQQSTIVVMEQGKPDSVIPVDPMENDILRPNPTGAVMIRLADPDTKEWEAPQTFTGLDGDFARLQRYEHLAEPLVFDRRIAVPWVVANLPGPEWTHQILGEDEHEEALWSILQDILRLDEDDPRRTWDDQAQMLHYRKQYLQSLKVKSLHLSAPGTDLTFSIPRKSHWEGGMEVLPSGRKFIPTLPMEQLFTAVVAASVEGTVSATRPIGLFGQTVTNATFTFEHGVLASYDAEWGKHLLQAFFALDEGAARIGEVALADENTAVSRIAPYYGVSSLDRERTSRLRFGSVSLSSIDRDIVYDEEGDLHTEHGFNLSNVYLDCPFGSEALTVTAHTEDGTDVTLIEHGIFID